MHLSSLSDQDGTDCSLRGALRRMQYGLIATLLAIAVVLLIKGFAA